MKQSRITTKILGDKMKKIFLITLSIVMLSTNLYAEDMHHEYGNHDMHHNNNHNIHGHYNHATSISCSWNAV